MKRVKNISSKIKAILSAILLIDKDMGGISKVFLETIDFYLKFGFKVVHWFIRKWPYSRL